MFQRKQISARNWFLLLTGITLLTVACYLVAHFRAGDKLEKAGVKTEYLSKRDNAILRSILSNQDTAGRQDSTCSQDKVENRKQNIMAYLLHIYPQIIPECHKEVQQLIDCSSYAQLSEILPEYAFRQYSFFWLEGYGVFIELIFWSLFGVLANLLYSTSEYIRKKSFDPLEVYVQMAKLIYTPFCVLVIYISYNLVGNDQLPVQSSGYALCLAFLLGFFSGRMIELLSRLKDLLIPVSKDANDTAPAATPEADEPPADIFIEAIETQGEAWQNRYQLESIGTGIKKTNGLYSGQRCLTFRPLTKTDQAAVPIPPVISYTARDGKTYQLPTDVEATGSKIQPRMALAGGCNNINIKRPGCSVSRDGYAAGTIGLKVYKEGQPYILSCYHVLFAPELAAGTATYTHSSTATNTAVKSPGDQDPGVPVVLGKVAEGVLDSYNDCGLALLDQGSDVTDYICLLDRAPGAPLTVTTAHELAAYPVRFIGRTSGKESGRIKSSYCNCNISYIMNGREKNIYMKGLICISALALGGDSGAPVLDEDNRIIGIVIASSENETYVQPIQRILTQLNITLK